MDSGTWSATTTRHMWNAARPRSLSIGGSVMNARSEWLTPRLLRGWPLPAIQGSKYERGQILVIGGARPTPGAAMLSATAAMRVGGGHLTLGVAESVAVAVAVALPESGVIGLPENDAGAVCGLDAVAERIEAADVVLLGPGLNE